MFFLFQRKRSRQTCNHQMRMKVSVWTVLKLPIHHHWNSHSEMLTVCWHLLQALESSQYLWDLTQNHSPVWQSTHNFSTVKLFLMLEQCTHMLYLFISSLVTKMVWTQHVLWKNKRKKARIVKFKILASVSTKIAINSTKFNAQNVGNCISQFLDFKLLQPESP